MIGIGVYFVLARHLTKKAKASEAELASARLREKDDLIQKITAELQTAQLQVKQANVIIARLERENADLRAGIERQTPTYAAYIRKYERAEKVRQLWAEGWSLRQIMLHVYGYVGESSYRQVKRVLQG